MQTNLNNELAKYSQANTAVNKFIEVTRDKYGSHSYAAGYMGSKLCGIAATYLTKAQFAEFIAAMQEVTKANEPAKILIED